MTETVQDNPFLNSPQDYNFEEQLIPQPQLPMSAPNALGRDVLETTMQDDYNAVNELEPARHLQSAAEQLKNVRDHLNFDGYEKQQEKFGKLLLSENIPAWLLDQVGGEKVSPVQLIANLTTTGDETLTNILQWHNHAQSEKQKAYEAERIAPMRERMITRLQDAVAKGLVSPEAASQERLDLIKNTPVLLDDEFGLDRTLSGLTASGAYRSHEDGNQFVVLSASTAEKREKGLEHTFTHEMVHVITGNTSHSMNTYDYQNQKYLPQREQYGMGRLFTSQGYSEDQGSKLNEAVTEHFAQVLLGGDMDKITPFDLKSYATERYLLKALCTRGDKQVSPKLFVDAMMSDLPQPNRPRRTADEQMPVEITNLEAALAEAYPGKQPFELYNEALEQASQIGTFTLLSARKTAKLFTAAPLA